MFYWTILSGPHGADQDWGSITLKTRGFVFVQIETHSMSTVDFYDDGTTPASGALPVRQTYYRQTCDPEEGERARQALNRHQEDVSEGGSVRKVPS